MNREAVQSADLALAMKYIIIRNYKKWRPIYSPMGTLLHITAGNMEGLPVFSIVEGLLTGNVNILKLPGNDGGLSMDIILRLIRLEPALADYIYVFDTSSGDLPAMSGWKKC